MSKHLMLIDTNHLASRAHFTGADPVRMIHGLIRREPQRVERMNGAIDMGADSTYICLQ